MHLVTRLLFSLASPLVLAAGPVLAAPVVPAELALVQQLTAQAKAWGQAGQWRIVSGQITWLPRD